MVARGDGIKAQLRQYLSTVDGETASHLADDASLELASAQIVDLILWSEQTFGITFMDADMAPDHFETLERATSMIERYLLGSP